MFTRLCLLACCLAWLPALGAATATTTLQMIWPNDTLGMDQAEAVQKAVDFLHSDEFAQQVVQLPPEWKEKLANALGVNDYHNTQALASGFPPLLSVQPESEHGVITLSVTTDDADLALTLAKRCAQVAVNESHYKIAEKLDPEAANIAQQMEAIEDNIQQLNDQLQIIAQEARTPADQHGASIGAPIDMGRVVNPGASQRRLQTSNLHAQMTTYRQQYKALNQQLQQAVNAAWQGKPKLGLVVIDQADLEGGL